eukprot:GHVP01047775.1.p1 GENE.GHVP01047775.1~~GHVP01047775.1.p1  ORF type:complete len:247 (-),score=31.05 GHVP01047775.1:108-848(-)
MMKLENIIKLISSIPFKEENTLPYIAANILIGGIVLFLGTKLYIIVALWFGGAILSKYGLLIAGKIIPSPLREGNKTILIIIGAGYLISLILFVFLRKVTSLFLVCLLHELISIFSKTSIQCENSPSLKKIANILQIKEGEKIGSFAVYGILIFLSIFSYFFPIIFRILATSLLGAFSITSGISLHLSESSIALAYKHYINSRKWNLLFTSKETLVFFICIASLAVVGILFQLYTNRDIKKEKKEK